MGKKREDYEGMSAMRKCHDCGRPTRNYRCEKCHRKWLKKNRVCANDDWDDDWSVYCALPIY